MRRLLSVFTMLLVTVLGVQAQSYDTVSIKDIQEVPQADLGNCQQESSLVGDTVVIKATVVMDGDLSRIQGPESRNVWVQDGKGPWSGIDVFGFTNPTSPVDIQNLVAGDSVMITGYIDEFEGETEIIPLTGNNVESVYLISQNNPVHNTDITVDVLNDQNQNNNLTTGEQWEGRFVTIRDATVVSVQNFGNSRVSFDIQGPNGGRMNVSDQFLAQRTQQNDSLGSFNPPTVGTSVDSIKGVITHALNDCPGADSRGYELNPFDSTHYNYGPAPPNITGIDVNPLVPSNSEQANIKAEITDRNGIQSATLYYAVGIQNNNYNQVSMNNISGDTYEAAIPAQNNNTWVKYYVQAKDQNGMENTVPNVPNDDQPEVYKVKNSSLTIYDIQFTPFMGAPYFSDASVYEGENVTVEGVVTSTTSGEANNINAVFIQQKDQLTYGGIQLTQNASLSNFEVNDRVKVSGQVEESFGMTILSGVTIESRMGKDSVNAVDVNPANFSSSQVSMDNEPYEGMLVNLSSDTSQLYVVDTNPDAPSNFGEYRVGTDTFDPNSGARVLAGRNTNNVFSSNNVSYINSEQWASQAGQLNVKSKPVARGNSMDSLKGVLVYSFSNYKVLPRSNDDFYNYSDSVEDEGGGSGFANTEVDGDFQVYPNPTDGNIQLNLADKNLTGSVDLAVISMTGNVVHRERMTGNATTKTLDLQTADPGVYLIQLREQATGNTYQSRILVR